MNDYAELVSELYQHYGTWRKVAGACEKYGSKHPRSYWHGIAHGRIANPGRDARIAIAKTCKSANVLCNNSYTHVAHRKNVSYSLPIYTRLEELKNANSLSWNELAEMMLEAME